MAEDSADGSDGELPPGTHCQLYYDHPQDGPGYWNAVIESNAQPCSPGEVAMVVRTGATPLCVDVGRMRYHVELTLSAIWTPRFHPAGGYHARAVLLLSPETTSRSLLAASRIPAPCQPARARRRGLTPALTSCRPPGSLVPPGGSNTPTVPPGAGVLASGTPRLPCSPLCRARGRELHVTCCG